MATLIALVIGLGSLNVYTLVDDDAHQMAYSAIRGAIAAVASEAAVSRLVRHSPTQKRSQAIAKASQEAVVPYRRFEEENRTLKKEHQDLKTKNANLAQVVDRQAKAAKTFAARHAARAVANATRNVSAVAGEVVPFVGTAIVVGLTAWDIYDACQSLKDLNELNAVFGHTPTDDTKVCGLTVPTADEAMREVRANWAKAYQKAANAVNTSDSPALVSLKAPATVKAPAPVPTTAAAPSWPEIKQVICPVIGAPTAVCR